MSNTTRAHLTVSDLRAHAQRVHKAMPVLADRDWKHAPSAEELLEALRQTRVAEAEIKSTQRSIVAELRSPDESGRRKHRATAAEIGAAYGQRHNPEVPMTPGNVTRELKDWGLLP